MRPQRHDLEGDTEVKRKLNSKEVRNLGSKQEKGRRGLTGCWGTGRKEKDGH